jgi:GTP-binding protein Era
MDQPNTNLKSGFAVLVGRTNVGKSTLLNALVGTKIAIVTPKPQTTRDSYHGIVTRPGIGQVVFVDTPGFFKTQPSKLVANLHHRVRDAVEGIDLVVHVVDPSRSIGPEDQRVLDMVEQIAQPKILCINKSDLPSKPFRETWLKRGEKYASVVEVSARNGDGVEFLLRAIFRHLPEGVPHYPDGRVTNVTNEFWISELIREKIYLQTSEELPYTATVQVEAIEDRKSKSGDKLVYIKAAVLTTDDRYKAMLVGAGGRKIKNIGSAARKELEVAMNRKVFLDLAVIVDDEWLDRMR